MEFLIHDIEGLSSKQHFHKKRPNGPPAVQPATQPAHRCRALSVTVICVSKAFKTLKKILNVIIFEDSKVSTVRICGCSVIENWHTWFSATFFSIDVFGERILKVAK